VAHIDLLHPVCVVRPGAKYVGKSALSWWCWLERSQQSIPPARSVPAPSAAALVRPYNAQSVDGRRRQGQDLPATRDLGPSKSCTVRSNPARAVVPLRHPPQSRASRAPLITLPYSQDYLSGHLHCRTRFRLRATRPFQSYPSRTPFPRALCAARLNTQLSSINKAAHP
jgi:hypothetical protein